MRVIETYESFKEPGGREPLHSDFCFFRHIIVVVITPFLRSLILMPETFSPLVTLKRQKDAPKLFKSEPKGVIREYYYING